MNSRGAEEVHKMCCSLKHDPDQILQLDLFYYSQSFVELMTSLPLSPCLNTVCLPTVVISILMKTPSQSIINDYYALVICDYVDNVPTIMKNVTSPGYYLHRFLFPCFMIGLIKRACTSSLPPPPL